MCCAVKVDAFRTRREIRDPNVHKNAVGGLGDIGHADAVTFKVLQIRSRHRYVATGKCGVDAHAQCDGDADGLQEAS